MNAGVLLAFAGFAFVSSITPGPNNAMLLASGVNYGFRRTVPHIAGITSGCVVMLVLVGAGLGQVFAAVPELQVVLKYVGAGYLLWLAWQIARAGSVQEGGGAGRPLTVWQAASFQWVNPKAWIMVVGGVTAYAPSAGYGRNVAALAVVLAVVNLVSICVWAGFGSAMRPFLARPERVRLFNGGMAVLLVLSVVPMFW